MFLHRVFRGRRECKSSNQLDASEPINCLKTAKIKIVLAQKLSYIRYFPIIEQIVSSQPFNFFKSGYGLLSGSLLSMQFSLISDRFFDCNRQIAHLMKHKNILTHDVTS